MAPNTPNTPSGDTEAKPTPAKEKIGSAKSDVTPVSYASKTIKRERRYSDRIQPIIDQILSAKNIKPILFNLTKDLTEAFGSDEATIYAIDRTNKQIFSRNVKLEKIKEIRLDISPLSMAGYSASAGKMLNVENAYDKSELKKYHPALHFDDSWDQKTEYITKSALVVPLPHNKKLMGVLELLNKKNGSKFSNDDVKMARELAATLGLAMVKMEVEDVQERLISTSHAIHSADSIDDILISLKKPILQLFDATLVTVYVVDYSQNEIYSKVKSGNGINEIRVPISSKSVSGWVALEKKVAKIKNVSNSSELKKFSEDLTFDDSWDKKTGFQTKSMLAIPIMNQGKLMGVLQLVNRVNEEEFSEYDEQNGKIICDVLGLAFSNQLRLASAKASKYSYLLVRGIITEEELSRVTAKSREEEIDIQTLMLKELSLRREDIGKSLEHFYKIPYFEYNGSFILSEEVFAGLNKEFLKNNHWTPLQNDGTKAVILIDDPANEKKIEQITLNYPSQSLEFKVGLKIDIADFINSAVATTQTKSSEKPEELSSILDSLTTERELTAPESSREEEVSMFNDSNSGIVRLVNKFITEAYADGVSDIHIEPGIEKKNMKIRFRKDGVCHLYEEIPYMFKQAAISRLKIMARLNIAEKRLPQDGKIKMNFGNNEIELRVATCPTVGGNEDIVMRILASSKPIPLDKMNFSPRNLKLTKQMIQKPYGLILVVGPTGSGKTTTLHSVLGHINKPEKKIWTAEDPVEITQEGLRQVQMQSNIGLDFARAMRSFLRGDPDVIMVGEMRDQETCAIGLEASLTGHLVLSTLHTNSAPETITRLIDMGMNPINFADALLVILAQRLVRTLCKFCKQPYQPTKEEFDRIIEEYGPEDFERLEIQFSEYLTFYRAVGCARCGQSGYSGRTGLHELLEGTSEIKRMVMKKALMEDIRRQAIKDGMTTLKQDGIAKIFKGDCDLKQVLAVCVA